MFLDITASSDARDTMVDVVRRTAEQVFIPFTVGGGIRTVEDARGCCGPAPTRSAVNTAAVERPELIAEIADEFGAQCVVCAIDAKRRAGRRPGSRSTSTAGARRPASTPSSGPPRPTALGAGEILLTSMDRDGTKDGFDLELTRAVSDAVGVPVIASGGVGTLEHLVDGVVEGGADAVLAASIFHFGEHGGRGRDAGGLVRPPVLSGGFACG